MDLEEAACERASARKVISTLLVCVLAGGVVSAVCRKSNG